ncbi:MAG TPA: hypothetical protein DCY13_17440, partial [Verrucomicrobiales bacterium]|nr:hypothetical protein [Verrucomicrobiales bacterium]
VPMQPKVTGLSMLPDGFFQITAEGTPSLAYDVEYRNDVAAGMWLLLTNLTANPGTGALNFIDPEAANLAQRFYRFTLP